DPLSGDRPGPSRAGRRPWLTGHATTPVPPPAVGPGSRRREGPEIGTQLVLTGRTTSCVPVSPPVPRLPPPATAFPPPPPASPPLPGRKADHASIPLQGPRIPLQGFLPR